MSDIFTVSIPTLSLIQAIIKKPWNFKNRNRLTQLTPGSKNIFLGTILGGRLFHGGR